MSNRRPFKDLRDWLHAGNSTGASPQPAKGASPFNTDPLLGNPTGYGIGPPRVHNAKRLILTAAAIQETIAQRRYTCYAAAICRNHTHLVIRTHRDKAREMWEHCTRSIRDRVRLRFPTQISPRHPVISARPYNVRLYSPVDIWPRIRCVEGNPAKDRLPPQHWHFVTRYDNWPLHKRT